MGMRLLSATCIIIAACYYQDYSPALLSHPIPLPACYRQIEFFCLEIEVCQKAKEAAKAAEERKKTVIVGDMQPLADALPTLSVDTMSGV